MRHYTSTLVVAWVPVPVAEVVSVVGHPRVDLLSIRIILWVPVGALFVVAIESNLRGVGQLFTLGVVLDNAPVLLNGDVNIAKLDLSLLLLLDLGELVPLEGEVEAVAAPRVHVGDNPHILDVGGHNFFETLKSQLLLVSPLARRLIRLIVCHGSGRGENGHLVLGHFNNNALVVVIVVNIGIKDSDARLHDFAKSTHVVRD